MADEKDLSAQAGDKKEESAGDAPAPVAEEKKEAKTAEGVLVLRLGRLS